jgi:hypothetical protein
MNNLFELKTQLFKAHRHDKKQTYYALAVTEVISLMVFISVSYGLMISRKGDVPAAVFWVLLALPVGTTIPFIYRLIQAVNRPNRIIEFIEALDNGAAIEQMITFTDYKIIFPGRRINFRFYQMEYMEVLLDNPHFLFKLPISIENVQPLKSLLSRPFARRYGIGGTTAHWSAN